MTGRLLARLAAPAKLTWDLAVTGTRGDGWHLLRCEMVTLSLADTLELYDAPTTAVEIRGPDDPVRDTAVSRALAMLGRTARVVVHKAIPVGGGLGGGSADAGAVLRWGGWRDLAAAATVGADVPFCLVGGRALVEGVGEHVSPLPFLARTVTLFFPPFGVPTAAVYRAFDEGHRERGRNELTAAAIAVEPRLRVVLEAVEAATGRPATLAGSGSTVFIEGSADVGPTVPTAAGPVVVKEAHTVPTPIGWPAG